MATNEILPFASTNTGTNLLTQAEYAADAQRVIGHQPGIARSKLENKALRQASLMAAGLAEFIADYQSNNVTDSLTAQQVADYLLAAITANIPVVPDASETTKGKIQLANAVEAQALVNALKAITPASLEQSLKGTNQQLTQSGYQRLPGSLLLEWNFCNVSTSSSVIFWNAPLPTAFPNAALLWMAVSANGTDDSAEYIHTVSCSVAQWFGVSKRAGGTPDPGGTMRINLFAIGY